MNLPYLFLTHFPGEGRLDCPQFGAAGVSDSGHGRAGSAGACSRLALDTEEWACGGRGRCVFNSVLLKRRLVVQRTAASESSPAACKGSSHYTSSPASGTVRLLDFGTGM